MSFEDKYPNVSLMLKTAVAPEITHSHDEAELPSSYELVLQLRNRMENLEQKCAKLSFMQNELHSLIAKKKSR